MNDFTKLDIVKLVANVVVGVGAAKITKMVIENNIDEPEKLRDELTVKAGSLAIGGLVSSAASDYVEEKIDWAANLYKRVRAELTGNGVVEGEVVNKTDESPKPTAS